MPSAAALAAPRSKDIFRLAWPMTLKAIFLHGTVVIDGWMVSSLGEVALASMGIAAALGGIVLGAIFAFSHAMQIRTAQLYGGRDPVHLKSVLASGLMLSMGIGLLGIAALLIFGETLIGLLAQSEVIADGAWSYLTIFTIVVAGYGLIHGLWGLPAMGVAGAALGSALGITAQTSYLAIRLGLQDGHLRRIIGWQKGTFARTFARHAAFSLPIAATFISATLATHICTLIYANMALPAFAAMTLIAPWNMVAGQISMQWTQASGILVAQLLGNRTPEETLEAFLSTVWRGAFIAAGIVGLIFLIMGLTLNQIYPSLSDETRTILLTFIPLMILIQPFRATNAVCGNTLRASGDTLYVMHIFVWSQWAFRVPLTALGVLYFDLPAVLILSLIFWEEIVKFLPFHRRLWRGTWRYANVLD